MCETMSDRQFLSILVYMDPLLKKKKKLSQSHKSIRCEIGYENGCM